MPSIDYILGFPNRSKDNKSTNDKSITKKEISFVSKQNQSTFIPRAHRNNDPSEYSRKTPRFKPREISPLYKNVLDDDILDDKTILKRVKKKL